MKNCSNIIPLCIAVLGLFCSCSNEGKIIEEGNVSYRIISGQAYAIGIVHPSDIITLSGKVHGYSVVGIADSAFTNERCLEKVIIKEGIKSLGNYSFARCTNLKKVILPNSLETIDIGTFKDCKSLCNITLPDSLIHINDSAFFNAALRIISFPFNLKRIGKYAFAETSLCGVNLFFPNNLTSIGDGAFSENNFGSIVLPESIDSIGKYAFYGRINSDIYIPEHVSYIGEVAFGSCDVNNIYLSPNIKNYVIVGGCLLSKDYKSLISISKSAIKNGMIEIPNGVEIIPEYGIHLRDDVKRVTKIILPNTLKKISRHSFYYYYEENIKELYIPSSVDYIEEDAFYGNIPSISFKVDSKNQYYSSEKGVLYDKCKTRLIKYPMYKADYTFIIPSSVKSIEMEAFEECLYLETLNTNQVKKIPSNTCRYCENLQYVICPSVDSIMSNAFDSFNKFFYCVLGEDIKYINGNAIDWDTNSLTCYASTPPYIDGDKIAVNDGCRLIIPANSLYLYQRDEKWSKFLHIETLP